jgi:DNA-directed RNA polymerase subunit beta'
MGCFSTCRRGLWRRVLYFASYIVIDPGDTPLAKKQLLTEASIREYREKYPNAFKAGMGAEAIKKLLDEMDLDEMARSCAQRSTTASGQRRMRAIRRLEVVEAFRKSGNQARVDDTGGHSGHPSRTASDGAT